MLRTYLLSWPSCVSDASPSGSISCDDTIYVESVNPNATVAEVLGARSIRPEVRTQLAASLPYRRIVHGGQNTVLPEGLRHFIRVQLYNNAQDRSLERPSLSARVSLASLNTRRLGLSYVGATPEDQARWDSYTGATSLPAYLLEVKPQLRLDEVTLAEGSAVRMGRAQLLDITLEAPYARDPLHYAVTAGDELNLGVNANGVTPTEVQARLAAVPPESSAEQLHQLSLHYWLEQDFLDGINARTLGVHAVRLPSFGLFGSPLTTEDFYGIPVSGSYRAHSIDIQRELAAVVAATPTPARNFNLLRGIQGSYLESSVPEQLFNYPQGSGTSAAQLLLEANTQGNRIQTLTRDNLAQALPTLNVSPNVKASVEQAVNAGLWVVIPRERRVKGAWSGSGYLVIDPNTGTGAYQIEGGLNGGLLPAACGEGVNPIRVLALNLAIAAVVERFQARGMTWVAESMTAKGWDPLVTAFELSVWAHFQDFLIGLTLKESLGFSAEPPACRCEELNPALPPRELERTGAYPQIVKGKTEILSDQVGGATRISHIESGTVEDKRDDKFVNLIGFSCLHVCIDGVEQYRLEVRYQAQIELLLRVCNSTQAAGDLAACAANYIPRIQGRIDHSLTHEEGHYGRYIAFLKLLDPPNLPRLFTNPAECNVELQKWEDRVRNFSDAEQCHCPYKGIESLCANPRDGSETACTPRRFYPFGGLKDRIPNCAEFCAEKCPLSGVQPVGGTACPITPPL